MSTYATWIIHYLLLMLYILFEIVQPTEFAKHNKNQWKVWNIEIIINTPLKFLIGEFEFGSKYRNTGFCATSIQLQPINTFRTCKCDRSSFLFRSIASDQYGTICELFNTMRKYLIINARESLFLAYKFSNIHTNSRNEDDGNK